MMNNSEKNILGNRLLRIQEVSRLTSLSKSTINLWVAQEKFVKPVALSSTLKVWRLQDVLDWIDSKVPNSEAKSC